MEVRLGWLLVWGGNPTELWNFAGPSAGVEPFHISLLTGLERSEASTNTSENVPAG